MELFSWLGRGNYLPHGYCFTWTPGLLWSMVGADALIAAAYYSIPVALVTLVRKRGESAYNGIVLLFSAFIFACGTTHLLSIWTIWNPDYGVETLGKMITAGLSVFTAVMLWPLIPRALKIPSVDTLQSVIARLEAEADRRQKAELRLDDTRASLAVTLASIGAGIITTDRDGRVTTMNSLCEQITGWRIAQARGRPLWEVWVREGEPAEHRARNPVDVLLDAGVSLETAHSAAVLSRGGRRTPVEVKAAPLYAEGGAVRGIALVFRDMTQIRLAQAESDRLAAIVESSNDAIVSQTLDGRVTSWNRAAEALFGYTAAEIVGQPVALLIPGPHEAHEAEVLRQLAAGVKVPPFDALRTRKDGSLVEVSVTVSPVHAGDGSVLGASTISRDISHQRHLEALRLGSVRMEAENRQIQAASRMKSEFLANMSHELRTPLNAIIGFADLLHAGMVPTESSKHRDFLGHIRASGRHLLQLINAVLDLSKVEAGKFEFFPEPVDLPRLAQEVIAFLRTEAGRKDVTLELDVDPTLTDLHLDPARLKQVLYNFLSNAIKFTSGGGRVVLRGKPEGADAFRVEVEDNGIGVKEADLAKLFVEFQQLDAGFGRRHPGTGLGLALTRRLVEAQGGSVGVRSEHGRGSVFHAVMPRRVQASEAEGAGAPAAADDAPCVLLIEDNASRQAELIRALAAVGARSEAAATREDAVRLAAARSYAGIVLDLSVQGDGALALLSAVREQPGNRTTPVCGALVSAGLGPPACVAIDDLLVEPADTPRLREMLERALPGGADGSTVLMIDDDVAAVAQTAGVLRALGCHVHCRQDGASAVADVAVLQPDAIFVGLSMRQMNGFEIIDQLRQQHSLRPVFLCIAAVLSEEQRAALLRSAQGLVGSGRAGVGAAIDRWRRALAPQTEGQAG